MSELSKNIMARLDEFTARQGIISAEWCMLLDVTEEHFQSLELELARNRKTIEYGDSVVDRLELELASTKKMLDEALGYKAEFEKYLKAFHVELQQKNDLVKELNEATEVIGTILKFKGPGYFMFIDDKPMSIFDLCRSFLAKHEKKGGV